MILPSKERLLRGRAAVIACPREECRICLSACGFTAIRIESGRPYSDPDKCVGCGGCAAICPEGAIRLLRLTNGGAEITFPYEGELPELGDTVTVAPTAGGGPVPARVVWAAPKRPNAAFALVRAVIPETDDPASAEAQRFFQEGEH